MIPKFVVDRVLLNAACNNGSKPLKSQRMCRHLKLPLQVECDFYVPPCKRALRETSSHKHLPDAVDSPLFWVLPK